MLLPKPIHLLRCLLALLLAGIFSHSTLAQPLSAAERKTYAQEIEQSLIQLLDKCYPLTMDREHGGFLTTFTYDWKPEGPQDKMIVTQARHTWFPAKAARLYPAKKHLREAASHGFVFLKNAMWDKTHGGFYTWVTREGMPKDPEGLKSAYGNAFGIYALAAYYGLSKDTAALNLAKQAFYWLEKHSHDPKHGGYFQDLRRDGTPVLTGAQKQSLYGGMGYKDQNSSIHLLEAFSELYDVWPDALLQKRLQEMLKLVRDRITTEQGYLTLFLTPDWKPISFRDSSEAVREKNYNLDHVSFGHDIETAYLILEASHTLKIRQDVRTPIIAKKMADHSLIMGWDKQAGGFYERGYYFKGADTTTIIDDRKNWWSQAEGLNTLLLMARKYPNDPMEYGRKFKTQWAYIKQNLIDPVNGGWYEGGLDKEPDRKTGHKLHAWKAAYHDGRALMNCLHLLRLEGTHPPETPPPGSRPRGTSKSE